MQDVALPNEQVAVTGALDFDRTATGIVPRRLPDWTRMQVPAFMEMMVTQPSGVRLEFATDSNCIELDVLLTRIQMAARAPRRAVFDLVVDGERVTSVEEASGNVLEVDLRTPTRPQLVAGESGCIKFDGLGKALKQIEIWLPSSAQTELQGLRLDSDATLSPATPRKQPLWVHHGSSISHCAEATSPTRTWPAVAAARAGVQLLNLGLGGNCQLDAFVARTIAAQPADFISLKLGINVVNMDSMRERTFTPAVHGFLDTIRERQPTTPILIVSPIYCPSAETHPGPTLPGEDGKFVTFPGHEALRAGCLTLVWIRKILSRVVAARQAAGDSHLYYLDGLTLFSEADAADLPDDLHPNGAGYERMGERFFQHAFAAADAAFKQENQRHA